MKNLNVLIFGILSLLVMTILLVSADGGSLCANTNSTILNGWIYCNASELWEQWNNSIVINSTTYDPTNFTFPTQNPHNRIWGFQNITSEVQVYNYTFNSSGWLHHSIIQIQEISGANLTNYAVKLNVTYFNGMNSTFSDLRFTDSSNPAQELYYWIQSYSAGSSAIVYVKVPTLTASSYTNISMFYDNPAVLTTSDAPNTLTFFDDFTNEPVVNVNKWNNVAGTWDTSNGILNLTDSSASWKQLQAKDSSGSTVLPTSTSTEFDMYVRPSSDDVNWGFAVGNVGDFGKALFYNTNRDDWEGLGPGTNAYAPTGTLRHIRIDRTPSNISMYSDGHLLSTYTSANTGTTYGVIGFFADAANYMDNIMIKQFVLSEPTYNIQQPTIVNVTLNSPANATVGSSNVNFNCSASASTGTIQNISLWTNSGGTWSLNETVNPVTSSVQAHGMADIVGEEKTTPSGAVILIKATGYVTKITKFSSTDVTKVYLQDSSGTELASASFIGDEATLNYNLIAGNSYRIVADKEGATYTRRATDDVTSPISNTYLNWTGGIVDGSSASSRISIIQDLTFGIPGASATTVFSKNVSNVIWNCQACASDGTCSFAPTNFTYSTTLPSITVNNSMPANNSKLISSTVNFGCNTTGVDGANITLVLLNVTGTHSWTQVITGLNTNSYNATFTNSTVADGTYYWKCDVTGDLANGTSENWTFGVDANLPSVNIIYPTNTSYTTNVSALNYTVSDTNLQTCWFSSDFGLTKNYITCGTNLTGLTSVEGSNTWRIYANDTYGNENFSSVTFFKDSVKPAVSITSPSNTTYDHNVTNITFTASDTNLHYCWYSLNGGITNTTILCAATITGITSVEGSNTWTVYANDTLGNENSSTVTFDVDTLAPDFDISYPVNNLFYNYSVADINYTLTHLSGLMSSCWYSLNGGVTNTTFTCGQNITGLSANEGINTWRISGNDTANNYGTTNVTFTVDTTTPNINIVYPTNTYYSAPVTTLNYTVSDANLQSCWYTLNGGVTNTTVACGTNLTGLSSNEGSNTWSIYAMDIVGHTNVSTITFVVDTIAPTISFGVGTLPTDSNMSQSNIYMNTTWTEANFQNITYRIGGAATDSHTDASPTYNFDFTGLTTEGYYFYNVTICDKVNHCTTTSDTRKILLDITPPTVQQGYTNSGGGYYPGVNNTYVNNATVNFTANSTDNFGLNNVTITVTTTAISCYQESANVSNQTGVDGSCGLDYTGSYDITSITDPYYSQGDVGAIYINYTKPIGSTASSLWRVKQHSTTDANYSLPASCWNYDSTKLMFRLLSIYGGSWSYTSAECYNGTAWAIVHRESQNAGGGCVSNGVASNIYDGDWNTGAGYCGSQWIILSGGQNALANLFEESMIWNVVNTVNTTTSNSGGVLHYIWGVPLYLLDGVYNWIVTAYDVSSNFVTTTWMKLTVDTVIPAVAITYPENISYNYLPTTLNWTFNDINPNNCWYTLNGGVTNTTVACGDLNKTGLTSNEGTNTWSIYANDSAGNINNYSVTFFTDTVFPLINLTYPNNISYTTNVTTLNYTFTELNPNTCWYSLDNGVTNVTLPCGTNAVGLTSNEGSNTWKIFINDTANNRNSSSVTFFKDSILPNITVSSPAPVINNSVVGTNLTLNVTVVDTNLASCWYVYGSNPVNVSGSQNISDGDFNTYETTPWLAHTQDRYLNFTGITTSDEIYSKWYRQGTNGTCTQVFLTADFQAWNYSSNDWETFREFSGPNSCSTLGSQSTIYSDAIPSTYLNGSMLQLRYPPAQLYEVEVTAPRYLTCTSGVANVTNFTSTTSRNLLFYANDTLGNLQTLFVNWSYGLLEINQTFNSITYETATESFTANVSAQSGITPAAATLIYDSNVYAGTVTNLGNNNYQLSTSITIPTVPSQQNDSFYWHVQMSDSSFQNLTTQNQTVNPLLLSICNGVSTYPYVKYTFEDETTTAFINATADLFTWSYWIGDGTIAKSLLFTNTTQNPSYTFCLNTPNYTLHNTLTAQYASPGYPQRTSFLSNDLTNVTTNKTLFLLATGNGVYSTYQVILANQGSTVPGVTITAERQFSGIWTLVTQGLTGTDGSVTFWLNPNYQHRITASKAGCTQQQFLITPTQSAYTITFMCNNTGNIGPYTSPIQGVTYTMSPHAGVVGGGVMNFTFIPHAEQSNLISAKLELADPAGTVVAYNQTICLGAGCTITLSYNMTEPYLKGRYYVDLGQGLMLLEGDAMWKYIKGQPSDSGTLKNFFGNLKDSFNFWSSSNVSCSTKYHDSTSCGLDGACVWHNNYDCKAFAAATCAAQSACAWNGAACVQASNTAGVCLPSDEMNKIEYSRFVWFFLVMAVLLALLSKFTGYDAQHPGWFVLIMTGIIVMLTMYGGINGEGYFYLDGLSPIHWINNWAFAVTTFILSMGILANLWRRMG